jgi:hypothetical protein
VSIREANAAGEEQHQLHEYITDIIHT